MKGKINLHPKGTLKGIRKWYFYSYKILQNSIKIWKKTKFAITNFQPISHTST